MIPWIMSSIVMRTDWFLGSEWLEKEYCEKPHKEYTMLI